MKKQSLACVFLFLFPWFVQATDRYVALSTGTDIWVLKIDSTGKPLQAHHQHLDYFTATIGISPVSTNSGPALAVFKTENLVDVTKLESALFQNGTFSAFHDFGSKIVSEAGVLQVTQKIAGNWLLTRSGFSRLYQSLGINASQEWNGKVKTISPALAGSIITASVSADGRMLTEIVATKSGSFELVNQKLAGDSSRQGAPAVIGLSALASSVDISNELPDSVRMVVYRASHVAGIDTVENQVFLQKISSSGKALESARSLTPSETRVVTLADSSQSVAMDPEGKFVLYTAAGDCGKKVLKLQMLDPQAANSSSPKVIFGCNRVSETQSGVESVDVAMADIATGL